MKESDAQAFIRAFRDSTSLAYVAFQDQHHEMWGGAIEAELGSNFLVQVEGMVRARL